MFNFKCVSLFLILGCSAVYCYGPQKPIGAYRPSQGLIGRQIPIAKPPPPPPILPPPPVPLPIKEDVLDARRDVSAKLVQEEVKGPVVGDAKALVKEEIPPPVIIPDIPSVIDQKPILPPAQKPFPGAYGPNPQKNLLKEEPDVKPDIPILPEKALPPVVKEPVDVKVPLEPVDVKEPLKPLEPVDVKVPLKPLEPVDVKEPLEPAKPPINPQIPIGPKEPLPPYPQKPLKPILPPFQRPLKPYPIRPGGKPCHCHSFFITKIQRYPFPRAHLIRPPFEPYGHSHIHSHMFPPYLGIPPPPIKKQRTFSFFSWFPRKQKNIPVVQKPVQKPLIPVVPPVLPVEKPYIEKGIVPPGPVKEPIAPVITDNKGPLETILPIEKPYADKGPGQDIVKPVITDVQGTLGPNLPIEKPYADKGPLPGPIGQVGEKELILKEKEPLLPGIGGQKSVGIAEKFVAKKFKKPFTGY